MLCPSAEARTRLCRDMFLWLIAIGHESTRGSLFRSWNRSQRYSSCATMRVYERKMATRSRLNYDKCIACAAAIAILSHPPPPSFFLSFSLGFLFNGGFHLLGKSTPVPKFVPSFTASSLSRSQSESLYSYILRREHETPRVTLSL